MKDFSKNQRGKSLPKCLRCAEKASKDAGALPTPIITPPAIVPPAAAAVAMPPLVATVNTALGVLHKVSSSVPQPKHYSTVTERIFRQWSDYIFTFWNAICLDTAVFGIPVSNVPVYALNANEPHSWCVVGSGESGTTYEVTKDRQKYLVKHILERPSRRVLIPGLPPTSSEELEVIREGAFIVAMSAIGYSATICKTNALFLDVSCTPYKVFIGMEFIQGDLLEDIIESTSLTQFERLLAAAELGFLLEYLSLYHISHNDLGLGNLMLRENTRRIVLIDYGKVSVNCASSDLKDYLYIVDRLFPTPPWRLLRDLKKCTSFTQVGELRSTLR